MFAVILKRAPDSVLQVFAFPWCLLYGVKQMLIREFDRRHGVNPLTYAAKGFLKGEFWLALLPLRKELSEQTLEAEEQIHGHLSPRGKPFVVA